MKLKWLYFGIFFDRTTGTHLESVQNGAGEQRVSPETSTGRVVQYKDNRGQCGMTFPPYIWTDTPALILYLKWNI